MAVVPLRRRPIAVDWSGLEGVTHYFEVKSGEVHLVQSRLMVGEGEEGPSEAEVEARCAAGEWIAVEPLPSSVEYEWMATFVESVKAPELAGHLRPWDVFTPASSAGGSEPVEVGGTLHH